MPWNESPWKEVAAEIVGSVSNALECLGDGKYSPNAGLKVVSGLMSVSFDMKLLDSWTRVVHFTAPSFSSEIYDNLLQYLIDDSVPAISNQLRDMEGQDGSNSCDIVLTNDEKAVLHYASGSILRKLSRRFARGKKNKASELYLDVIKTWSVSNNRSSENSELTTLTDKVISWTTIQNRGGLIFCSPRFFQFMKVVEVVVRKELNIETLPNFAGKDIFPVVVGRVKTSRQIQKEFRVLIGYNVLSEKLCEGLLEEVLCCWVAMRARQLTKKYTFNLKMTKGGASRMGTPSLRKTIDKH
jgi:hypothetical protein